MAVLKVIELMAESPKGWSEAADKAVRKASKSLNGIKSVWVKDQSAKVEDGKIVSYRVTVKVSFEIKG